MRYEIGAWCIFIIHTKLSTIRIVEVLLTFDREPRVIYLYFSSRVMDDNFFAGWTLRSHRQDTRQHDRSHRHQTTRQQILSS